MNPTCERLYHLTDAGISGPAIPNPIPLAMLRDDADTICLMLTIAYNAGAAHGMGVCREATLTELERAVAASDRATDAKALDRLAADMNAVTTYPNGAIVAPRRTVECVGNHENLTEVKGNG